MKAGLRGAFAVVATALALACVFLFADGGLAAQPPFVDEAANLAQRRYWRIWSERHHPDWLEYAAYDHAPLDKLWLGWWATQVPGGRAEAVPLNLDAWRAWINRTHVHADPGDLAHARCGMLALSAAGCLGVAWLAWELAGAGAAAAALALFVGSPLVFRHARLAMPEVALAGAEAAALAAAALAMRLTGSRRGAALALAAGFAAVAAVAKLSGLGVFAAIVAVGTATLFAGPWRVGALGLLLTPLLAAAVVLWADPLYTCNPPPGVGDGRLKGLSPWGRLRFAVEHRAETLAGQGRMFPKDFIPPAERPKALLVQGLGRWSCLARGYSVAEADLPWRERARWSDYARAALLGGLALGGLAWALARGWRRRPAFPREWLLCAWAAADTALLLRGLTLDWDRYYIVAIAWSSVAAGCAVGWLAARGRAAA